MTLTKFVYDVLLINGTAHTLTIFNTAKTRSIHIELLVNDTAYTLTVFTTAKTSSIHIEPIIYFISLGNIR